MDDIITKAALAVGGVSKLATALGDTPQAVTNWRARGVPHHKCPAIERITNGAVPCEESAPGARWVRAADPDWPWHPDGRPLLDVAAPAEARAA